MAGGWGHDATRISWGKPAADFGPSAAFWQGGGMRMHAPLPKPCGWAKLSSHFPHPREYAGQRNARRGSPQGNWMALCVEQDAFDPPKAVCSGAVRRFPFRNSEVRSQQAPSIHAQACR